MQYRFPKLPEQAGLLEMGLAVFAGLLLSGLAILALGRLIGAALRGRRQAAGPPSVGSVPPERHYHIGAVAAR